MIIPVRCFTCGRVVGQAYEAYTKAVAAGTDGKKALDDTGLSRFCCRRMVVSHAPLLKDAAPYE